MQSKRLHRITLHPTTGAIRDAARISGYVVKFHSDKQDPLYGTVDVKEFEELHSANGDDRIERGLHTGVRLSSMQRNPDGYLIVPKLHSEVMIVRDPMSSVEYVIMYSHVDLIQLDSHENISIGVREREPYLPDDPEADDVDELDFTGVSARTEYTKNTVETTIIADREGQQKFTQKLSGDGVEQVVGENKSVQKIASTAIELEHGDTKIKLNDNQGQIAKGRSSVTVEDGTVYLGSTAMTEDAVLGQQLASILSELVGYLSQMMVPTSMGPQPPANVLPSFMALKAKIQAFSSSHSGFLTPKVKIQK